MPNMANGDEAKEIASGANAADAINTDVNSAPSSSDVGDKGTSDETLLDRFNKLDKETPTEQGTSPSPSSEDKGAEGAAPAADDKSKTGDDELGEPTEAEIAGYNPHTKRRVKTLVRQRNEAREQKTELETRIADLEPRVQAFDHMTNYVREAGLSTDDVNQGFEIMRMLKNDPPAALAALRPYVAQLEEMTGEKLPNDLRQKVDEGIIDEPTAQETSRLRATQTLTQEQRDAQVQRDAEQQRQNLGREVGNTVTTWEAEWKANDPDYAVLQPHVQREIERRLYSGQVPASPAAARKMAEEVKEQVKKELSAILPKKTPITPQTGSVQSDKTPAPTSVLEAMQRRAQGTF